MKKTIKKLITLGLAAVCLFGCTNSGTENKATNNATNSAQQQEEETDDTLAKLQSKYTDEANKTIEGFADPDALPFIYNNLGKDMSSYKLKDINGKDVQIANGEKTVIEFIRYDCSACIASGETIKGAEKKFDGNGYRFIQVFINGTEKDIDSYYKEAGITHFNTIIPYSDEVEKMLVDLNLTYVPAFLFVDENKKVSLGMVGYTFSAEDFEEIANDYAFPSKKLYEMTK